MEVAVLPVPIVPKFSVDVKLDNTELNPITTSLMEDPAMGLYCCGIG